MKKPRLVRWIAFAGGFILVSLVALALFLPSFIDSEIVKARVRAFVAEKTSGLATIDRVELFWFPWPGVVIRDAAIRFDQDSYGTFQQVRLYPSIRQLLTGNLAISRLTLDGAVWRLRFALPDDEPVDLDRAERMLRATARGLASSVPGMDLQLRGGVADIEIAGGRSLRITDIDVYLGVAAEKLDFAISASANLADRFRFAGELATKTLATKAQLSVENLSLGKVIEYVWPAADVSVGDGAATLNLKLSAVGLKSFRAEFTGAPLALGLVRADRKALIKVNGITANASGDENMFRIAVDEMSLVSPPLKAAGEFVFDRAAGKFTLKLTGRDLDAGRIRETALLLADDVASVREVSRYLQGGRLADIRVETGGRSLAEALDSKQAVITARLRGGKVFVPGPDLELENVAGSLLIAAGVLECKDCSANLGKAMARDGALRIGLAGTGAPFYLDCMVASEARELLSLLGRHVKHEGFRKELSRIRQVEGSLSGRLVLGDRLDAISPKVSAMPAGLSASYEPVPYPISLRGGRLNYANGKIEAEGLEGAVGRSSFSGFSGFLRADGAEQINISSASLHLDLEQTEFLLRKVEAIQARLDPAISAQGKIDFASLSLSGPLRDPGRWEFSGRGKVERVSVQHTFLPGPVSVTRGAFVATQEKISFADATVQLLDAAMTGGAVIEDWRKAPLRVAASASGVSGARMIEWLRRQSEIPPDYMLRAPLEFSSGRGAWRDKGNFSIAGNLTVAQGPRLSFDMTRDSQGFAIKEMLIEDGGRSARASLELAGDKWGLAFSGDLTDKMLARVFVAAPLTVGLLQGDFAANGFNQAPLRLFARGALTAKALVAPVQGDNAVIDHLVLHGDEAGLNIRTAELRWRRSRISVAGKIVPAQQALQVDVDVSADRLVWDEFRDVFGSGVDRKDNRNLATQLPPLEGIVRLKADSFIVGELSWSPLRGTARLAPSGISGAVEDGVVCGIRTAGRFAVGKNDEIELDVKLSVKDGDLESTSRCLSSESSAISGTYNLEARVAGGGNRERLAPTLLGEFGFVARAGKFVRAAPLDATFDYLNNTGDFNVAFPDLNKEAFPYGLISVQGTAKRQSIYANEVVIQASPYTITAQGSADLVKKTIDGKGLVTVLLPGDKLLKRIPLVGSMMSGSMVGIPIEVTGALEQPKVSYLSAAALSAEILNIPLRILKVPLEALQIFTPGEPPSEKK